MLRSRLGLLFLLPAACSPPGQHGAGQRIGFLDLLTDETLSEARKGFFVALKDSGYDSRNPDFQIIYRNAQGDQPTLLQACDYLVTQQVDLIAACPTLSTITAVQKTHTIPVFMMVSPRPDLAGLTDASGQPPPNLAGVYETLEYLDTSVQLIRTVLPSVRRLGALYNQAEPQSVLALERIEAECGREGIALEKLPVNNSGETQLVTEALLNRHIDAFFALPDNVVFASMEVIVSSCDRAHVPVFTSEEGLVRRGAVAAFGADMYRWGYRCGALAARYLSGDRTALTPECVTVRKRVYNAAKAKAFGMQFGPGFTAVDIAGTAEAQ
jgi:putative ABC transport system substrate-binding protein